VLDQSVKAEVRTKFFLDEFARLVDSTRFGQFSKVLCYAVYPDNLVVQFQMITKRCWQAVFDPLFVTIPEFRWDSDVGVKKDTASGTRKVLQIDWRRAV
jgi:hypothetical protein